MLGSVVHGWQPARSMSTPRWTTALGVLNGRLYAVGGEAGANDVTDLASTEAYDPKTGMWTNVANMTVPRIGLGVAAAGGKLYAAFGWNLAAGAHALSSIEAYDPQTNAWTTLASMRFPRDHGALGALGGSLYVVGGCNAWDAATDQFCTNLTASLEVYSPATNRWTTARAMPTPRWGLQVAALDGRLYALGGEASNGTRLAVLEAYDVGADRWSALAPMPDARAYFGVGGVGAGRSARLVVVGGCSQSCAQPYASAAVYSVARDAWAALDAPLPRPRFEFGAAVLNGVLYVAGGLHNTNASEAMRSVVALELVDEGNGLMVERVSPVFLDTKAMKVGS